MYERFKTLVNYCLREYQNMKEILMDYDALHATALQEFEFPTVKGEYADRAFYRDGRCHLSGWVCNESDADMKQNAYISHGWGAVKLSHDFDPAN